MSGLDGDDDPGARVTGRGDPRTGVRALPTGALAKGGLANGGLALGALGLGASGLDRDGEIVSASLLQGRREIVIRHAGQRYRLRITANDKLILTK
ncbi:hemin uptake protein HemP [Methylobacterium sp. WL18]|nr:hemin uptake protein HemP [Methylobacterium sp. WL18]